MGEGERPKIIFLFDVDGTLTKSRLKIEEDMRDLLLSIRKEVYTAFVGGSDLKKQEEQIGDDCLDIFDFGFPENGVSFYKGRELVGQKSILEFLGEGIYREFVDYCLKYLSELQIPVKRGTFVELRRSMINISPIGRNCTQEEREAFFAFDKEHFIRKKMVEDLKNRFGRYGIHFSIGGQISIDCFPTGWDKTYCLQHLEDFEKIIFFGDMTSPGGNDCEICAHERTHCITVAGPDDTIIKIKEMLKTLSDK